MTACRRTLFTLFASTVLACAPQLVVHDPGAERIDAFLTGLVPFGFDGAVIVARHDSVLLSRGYGMSDHQTATANTDSTVFEIGSITKQFTAAAILRLQEQGRLRVTDSLGRFFPQATGSYRNITIHQLLTHTSGVVSGTTEYFDDNSREAILERAFGTPLLAVPGEAFNYSNIGYAVLAAVIEAVSGTDYESFLRQELWLPAGMHHTGYRLPQWPAGSAAHWYADGIDNGNGVSQHHPDWNFMGSGRVRSTPGDMLRWHQALQGDRVLSAVSRAALFTPHVGDYGYGWNIGSDRFGTLIDHTGGDSKGIASHLRWYPDSGAFIMIFANSDGEPMLFGQGISRRMPELLFGDSVAQPPAVRQGATIDERIAGTYLNGTDSLLVSVTASGGVIRGRGQHAADALLGIGSDQRYSTWNTRAEALVRAIIQRDSLAWSPQLSAGQYRYVRALVVDSAGSPKAFRVVATVPDWRTEHEAMTIIRVPTARGDDVFRFHWAGDDVAAIGGAGIPEAADVRVRVATDGGLVGYHIALARTVRLERDNGELVVEGRRFVRHQGPR